MTLLLAAIPGHVLDPAKRPLFLLLLGFILTFSVARLNTQARAGAQRVAPAHGQHRHAGRPAHPPRRVRHHRHGGGRDPRVRRAARQPLAGGARVHLRLRRGAHAGRVRARPPPGGRVLDRRGSQEHRRRDPRAHLHHTAADRAAAAQHRPGGRLHHHLALAGVRAHPERRRVRRRLLPQGQAVRRHRGHLRPAGRLRRRAATGQTELALGAARVRRQSPRRWSGRGAATRASTSCGSGASTACGTSSAASRTSRCRAGTAAATATTVARAAVRPATSASRTSRR